VDLLFVSELVTSVIQVAAFSLIPFLVYVIGKKKTTRGFWKDLGFYRPEKRTVAYALLASLAMFLIMWGAFFCRRRGGAVP